MADTFSFKRDGGSGLLPDGITRLRIEDVEKKMGKSGHKYLNVRYAAIVRGQPKGGSVWDVLSESPAAAFKMDQFLDSLDAPESGEASIQWLKGKFVWGMIETATYTDKNKKQRFKNVVSEYVTGENAEQLLAGLDEEDEEEVAAPIQEPESKQSTPRQTGAISGKATPVRSGKGASVAEMEEEAFPL